MNAKILFSGIKCSPFVAFSIFTNGKQLFANLRENNNNSDVIECVRGIRVLAAMWVVFVHAINVHFFFLPLHQATSLYKVINVQHLLWREKKLLTSIYRFQFMETYPGKFGNSVNSIDVFLTLSGLLAARKMFNLMKK